MAAGDREVLKAIEDVTANNAKTVIEFCNGTRKLVVALEKKVEDLSNQIVTKAQEVAQLKQQLAIVQAKLYNKGTQ